MLKILPALLLLLSSALPCLSQTTIPRTKITVTIGDGDGTPLESATLSLVQAADSALIKTAFSDKGGVAEFDGIKEGSYRVLVYLSGYKRTASGVLIIASSLASVRVPLLKLEKDIQSLREVAVQSRKPFVERRLDRIIVNVESSIVSTGGSVLEVLEKSPGVMINQESSINLRGKQGVIVMIDGKPSPLSGADLINYLKGIPASSIETIEIITNPSARYDAAGNAGIINIKFKKDQRQGFNGNLTAAYGQGIYPKPSVGVNLNYRKKKLNIYGNYSHARPLALTDFYINRKFYDNNQNLQSVFDQTTFTKHPLQTHVGKIGIDYYAGSKTVLGVMMNINRTSNDPDGRTRSLISDPDGTVESISKTINHSHDRRNSSFLNFNLKHSFDSSGRELTVDLDYGRFHSATQQDFHSSFFSPDGTPLSENGLKNDQGGIISIKSLKADFVAPFRGAVKLEAGIKSSFVNTDNDIRFFNIVNEQEVLDPSRSNHFIYDENVNAAYASISKEFPATDIQLGLRAEQTHTRGRQLTTNENFSRNYIYLFPSFFINQKLSAIHQLSLSYSRRIDRPSYRELNPFRIFVDPYTYVVGDPSLRPVLTNSFELSHTLNGKYVTTLSYSRSKQVITDVFIQDDVSKISYQTPANLQDFDYYGLSFSAPATVGKWLSSTFQASVYYNRYSSAFLGGTLVNQSTSWDAMLNNSLLFGKGWTGELSGFYQSRNSWGLFTILGLSQVSMGIQKQSANKKSVYKLAMTDVFYMNHIAVQVKYQNMDFHTNRHWDSRQVVLSYTYRFGKNTVQQARRRTGGMEDEKKRAG